MLKYYKIILLFHSVAEPELEPELEPEPVEPK